VTQVLELPIPCFSGAFTNLLHEASPPLSPLSEMPPAFRHFKKHRPIWSRGFLAKPKAFSGISPVVFSFTHSRSPNTRQRRQTFD
jgi:hypothetical protein